MTLLEKLQSQEREFKKFGTQISELIDKSFFEMTFTDGESTVGSIGCKSFREYYNILNIYIKEDYREKGYLKFMYKSALQYAKQNGKIGLLSGNNLINENVTKKIYEHFNHYTVYINKTVAGRRTVLTDWIHNQNLKGNENQ